MKNVFLKTTILTGAILFLASGCSKDRLENDFVTPPENFRTGAYWYWMNGHVTKEGVVNDLKAMKKVVNTWVNRIIGDMNLPDEQRKVKPQYNSWRADSPLQPSGLLGQVTVVGEN
jgi:hypothetical protein